MTLSFRMATFKDRVQAFENIFDVWRSSEDLNEHVDLRLASIHHQRADFFVGTECDRVEVSLASFPFELAINHDVARTSFIGCVHTIADSRGQGYARQLMDWAEKYEIDRGTSLSLLFSDIDPDYYARLGYRICPAHTGTIDIESASVKCDMIKLDAFQLKDRLDWVSECYRTSHAHLAAFVNRSDFYWWFLTKKDPCDEYFVIRRGNEDLGYLRMKDEGVRWRLRDCAIGSLSASDFDDVIDGVVAHFSGSSCKEVYGWLPKYDAVSDRVTYSDRPDEITMIKSLSDITIDEDVICALDHLHEIDHV